MLAHRGAGAAACAGGVIVPVSADAWLCTTAGHRDLNAAHLSAHDADRGSEPVVRQLLTLLLLLLRSCQRRCARLQRRRSLQPGERGSSRAHRRPSRSSRVLPLEILSLLTRQKGEQYL